MEWNPSVARATIEVARQRAQSVPSTHTKSGGLVTHSDDAAAAAFNELQFQPQHLDWRTPAGLRAARGNRDSLPQRVGIFFERGCRLRGGAASNRPDDEGDCSRTSQR